LNLAVCVCAHLRCVPGAAAAILGLTLVPLLIAIGLGALYFEHHGRTTAVASVMTGLVAAAAGMTLSVGVKLGLGYIRQPVAMGLALVAFLGVAYLRLPLLLVLGSLAPLGIAWYRPRTGGGPRSR